MAVSDRNTDQSPDKFSWKRFLSGLFGSNIRETVADIRAIREGFKHRKQSQMLEQSQDNR